MLRTLALGLFASALAFGEPALVIPHVADGGGWRSTVAIFNGFSANISRVQINFRGDDGIKTPFSITNYGTVSSLELDLMPESSVYLETSGVSPTARMGWVEVVQLAGTPPVRGFAVFRQTVPGRPDFEAVSMGIKPAGTMTFPFDNTNGFVTSFAVVNLSQGSCTLGVAPLFDEFGTKLAAEHKLIGNLLANGHMAFVSTDRMPELTNKRGYLTFIPEVSCGVGGFAVLGLRFNPSGPFTNLLPLSMATP